MTGPRPPGRTTQIARWMYLVSASTFGSGGMVLAFKGHAQAAPHLGLGLTLVCFLVGSWNLVALSRRWPEDAAGRGLDAFGSELRIAGREIGRVMWILTKIGCGLTLVSVAALAIYAVGGWVASLPAGVLLTIILLVLVFRR